MKAAQAGGLADPRCEIRVQVFNDVELFGSPEDFKEHVTRSALKWFDYIEIAVGDLDWRIMIFFVAGGRFGPFGSGPPACPWLERGVLVQVATRSEDRHDAAEKARNALKNAVARGWAQVTPGPCLGETWRGLDPEREIRQVLDRRRRPSNETRVVAGALTLVGLLLLLALIAELFDGFLVHRKPKGPGSSEYDYKIDTWVAIAVVPVGLACWFIVMWLSTQLPSVAVREHSWSFRVGRHFWMTAVVLVAVAVVGYLFSKVGVPLE